MQIKLHFILFFLCGVRLLGQDLSTELEGVYNAYELMGMSVWVSVEDQETTYQYGLRDFDRSLEITSDTQFRIASISKTFTALGLLKLYDQGAFDLDDDISLILGYSVRNPQYPSVPITYRMLLSHQSSLQDGSGYTNFLTATFNTTPIPNISELLVPGGAFYTPNMWRTEDPGSYFSYSNINFGLIGTLIEKHSGERFDVFMKNEILSPLGITGSYNIQDLPDIDNLAVIYRHNGGSWEAQIDNYEGVMPPPPDLTDYIPGMNGVYFAPQGGLRISATETGRLLDLLSSNETNPIIETSTLNEMKSIQWDYNGSNGDNYFGLFNRWGLGVHHANVNPGDHICNSGDFSTFLGHPGEAYGLVSDAFFSDTQNVRFALMINGKLTNYQIGSNSSFYQVEEAVYDALCTYFQNTLVVNEINRSALQIIPNPTSDLVRVISKEFHTSIQSILFSSDGKVILSKEATNSNSLSIDLNGLESGVYFLYLSMDSKIEYRQLLLK